ncbi:MAG: hypothetical protein KAW67_08580 [Candidatus Eisenbacteria sp.]|nr:hypothetical protein [Candidatus Eisenbacteria bacterium]
MAKNITGHARYRLAAGAFAAAGGLWCLGAMFGYHAMTLLVIGMMNLAASMLLMSLRPPKGAARVEPRQSCERRSRGRQTAELTVRTLTLDRREAKPADTTLELVTEAGAARPRERKNRTWSI